MLRALVLLVLALAGATAADLIHRADELRRASIEELMP